MNRLLKASDERSALLNILMTCFLCYGAGMLLRYVFIEETAWLHELAAWYGALFSLSPWVTATATVLILCFLLACLYVILLSPLTRATRRSIHG